MENVHDKEEPLNEVLSKLQTKLDPKKKPLLPPKLPRTPPSSRPESHVIDNFIFERSSPVVQKPIPAKRPQLPTNSVTHPSQRPPVPAQRSSPAQPPPPNQRPPKYFQRPVFPQQNHASHRPLTFPNEDIKRENEKKNGVINLFKIKEDSHVAELGKTHVTNLNKLKSVSAPNLFGGTDDISFSNGLINDVILEEDDQVDGGDNVKKNRFSNMAGMAVANLRRNKMKQAPPPVSNNKGVRKWQSVIHRPPTVIQEEKKLVNADSENNVTSTRDRFSELHVDSESTLFDYVVVVSLDKNNNTPCIVFQFPPKFDKSASNTLLDSIPQFCFPGDVSSLSYNHGDTFSFVLTNDTGVRSYGFCRMIQTEKMEQPEVYCIVSPYGLFSLYTQILEEAQFQRQFSSTAVFSFLKTTLSKPLPQPTESIDVSFFSSGSKEGIRKVTLSRPGDSAIHEHVQLYVFFERFSADLIVDLLSHLLTENKVVLCSNSLSLLSTSCHALISLMYPFDWEHTFIPVLPNKLIDVLCLPTPYLLGILPSVLEDLEDLPIEDVSILDLDKGEWVMKANVKTGLPKNIRDQVITSVNDTMGVAINAEEKENAQNEIISEIFVQMYLQIMGHFESYYTKVDEVSVINSRPFYRASQTKEQKAFLKAFTPTQAFQKFTMARKSKGPSPGLFEDRYNAYKGAKTMDRSGHFKKNIENLLSVFKKKHN